MKILVLMKQVPDTAAPITVSNNAVDVSKVDKWAASPYDEYALEQALQIKDKDVSAKITIVTLGPARVREMVMQGLAMGADDAVIIKSDNAGELDGLAVAHVLAAAAQKIGFDLIFAGTKGVDDDQGWVGIAMSELLGLPLINAVRSTTIQGNPSAGSGQATARLQRDVEGGKETIEVTLPALVTSSQATEPRYPTLKGIMGAKKKPLQEMDVPSLGVAADVLKPRVQMVKLDMPPGRMTGRLITGEPAAQVKELVKALREQAKVI